MLPERVFAIGGWLSIATGALLFAAFVRNPTPDLWGVLPAAALIVGFGLFFLYVGRGARRDRQRLLESPQRPG